MTVDLRALLGPDGVARVADLAALTHRTSVSRWVASGRLLRPLPGLVALPEAAGHWRPRARAAVLWSGGLLAGRSALAAWDVVAQPGPVVHVAVGRTQNIPPLPPWLRVHRVDRPGGRVQDGLPVTGLAASLVDAWGHAHAPGNPPLPVEVARAGVIGAVRRRMVTAGACREAAAGLPRLAGRSSLTGLLDLVDGGCQSEFEVWGLRHLLDVPGLPPVRQQLPLRTRIGTLHLDGAWEDVRLGVELDGAAWHRQPDQRERDLRRDAAALAEGWVVVRVSHRRGTTEPGAVRLDLARAYAARRR